MKTWTNFGIWEKFERLRGEGGMNGILKLALTLEFEKISFSNLDNRGKGHVER